MVTLKLLDESEVIEKYDFLEYKIFPKGFYIKIKAYIKDNSELFIREYSDEYERNYSYHWQKKDGSLLIRWDNAPHYKDITTFPHHKHIGNKVLPSNENILKEVLEFIKKTI